MVRPCSHWIWCSGDETPIIATSNRLEQLTYPLLSQDSIPSFILLIGRRRRPAINRILKRQDNRICLDLDEQDDFPLLLVTAALEGKFRVNIPCCNPIRENHSVYESLAQAVAVIYSQLLYPFVDIFCFYLYCENDMVVVATHMALWIKSQPASRSGYPPQLVMVLSGHRWKKWDDTSVRRKFHTLVKEKTIQPLDSFFPEIVLLRIQHSGRFSLVRPCLVEHLQHIRQRREEAHALFAIPHLNSLLDRAFRDVGRSQNFSFDCLRASRQDFPVSPTMATHLEDFVSHMPLARQLHEFAAPVTASSILLDQYPPGMHLFKPEEVYYKLYNVVCLQVGRSAFQQDRDDGLLLPSAFSASVLANLESFFTYLAGGKPASVIHRMVLARYVEDWNHIQSSQSCFSCFTSIPQHIARCGHAFCENCIQIFGKSQESDPGLWYLSKCILCQSQVDLTVRVRPLTAGHGILCIDGGGVCGIIPSTVLELIQDSLGLPIPVQEHFSLAYGVSVGGLLILGLYDKGWSAATCTFKLETLAGEAFYSPVRGFFLFFIVLKWIHLVFLGCLYPSKGIDGALVKVFGNKRMANPSYATLTGTKIGVLATTNTKVPVTYMFTNYNGIGEARVGYVVHQGRNDVKTWEVARSTSAAPMYFLPKYIPGLGNLLDGGIVRNNPTLVGLSEFERMALGARPDFVLNLGAGSPLELDLEDEMPQRPRRYGWLTRLVRAYLSHLQGQRTWNDVTCLLKKEARTNSYYRLNVTLHGETSLDDTTAMPRLRSLVLQDTTLRDTINKFARRLFAALFYFELTEVPTTFGSCFNVKGNILCLRRAGDPALTPILERLQNSVLLINGQKTKFKSAKDAKGNIKVALVFVGHSSISLELKEMRWNTAFHLSGSPYILPELVSRSGLAAPFGTRTHKRKAESDLPERQSQRRRLSY
ncbi:acyl transferase/acyl hydrolase/lysophospholipase [Daldinia decipiens]|uniref:acyl transferase/acyl hydrolase/lysophospholipase n=1 Tax=Daldinia decipiens TaxID=326647 RepID=UPI0020C24B1D|nr:acyl transferase/acyl hydrolase/lysophospholipase [Daldinia decipiens]KAI1655482.1 acyl transferase/acyl hydrolase/lysophospholipase [Daldinia decipiens]